MRRREVLGILVVAVYYASTIFLMFPLHDLLDDVVPLWPVALPATLYGLTRLVAFVARRPAVARLDWIVRADARRAMRRATLSFFASLTGVLVVGAFVAFAALEHLKMQAAFLPGDPIAPDRWWTYFSYAFFHVDASHLAQNVVGLIVFGGALHARVGPRRADLVVMFAMPAAALASTFDGHVWAVGASGVVSALAGALLTLGPFAPLRVPLFGFSVPTIVPTGLVVLAPLAAGLLHTDEPIAHWAHLGGLAVGVVVGALLRAKDRPREAWFEGPGTEALERLD